MKIETRDMVVVPDPEPELRVDVLRAAAACPVQAIFVDELDRSSARDG